MGDTREIVSPAVLASPGSFVGSSPARGSFAIGPLSLVPAIAVELVRLDVRKFLDPALDQELLVLISLGHAAMVLRMWDLFKLLRWTRCRDGLVRKSIGIPN